jgi:hypothetical protein
VVIAEKENVVGLAAEQTEGLLVEIIYNAVTINQNLLSKFTSDKKVNDFRFCFELFALITLDFILLTVYIRFAVTYQTAAVDYSCKLSIFLSCYSR